MMANNLRTTGIGSLPPLSIEQAVQFSLSHDIPYLPQLPSLDGDMLDQVFSKSYSCLSHFSEKIGQNQLIKVQIAGPCSIKKYASKRYHFENYWESCRYLLDTLKPFTQNIIICLDEPYLDLEEKDILPLINRIQSQNYLSGLHSCGEVSNWKKLLALPLDFISFDSHLEHIIATKDLDKFLGNGNSFILGIDLDRELNRGLLKQLSSYDQESIIISPSCGMARKDEEYCRRQLDFLKTFEFGN